MSDKLRAETKSLTKFTDGIASAFAKSAACAGEDKARGATKAAVVSASLAILSILFSFVRELSGVRTLISREALIETWWIGENAVTVASVASKLINRIL
jgi:hypothetical protein